MMSTKKVVNSFGVEIDFGAAVELMDDDIREELNRKYAPCADQSFFNLYCSEHIEKFGERFELDKENPCY